MKKEDLHQTIAKSGLSSQDLLESRYNGGFMESYVMRPRPDFESDVYEQNEVGELKKTQKFVVSSFPEKFCIISRVEKL